MTVQYRWNQDVEAVEIEGEWIILHANHHTITKINGTGGVIWSLLERGNDVDTIIQALTEEFDVDAVHAASDVETFLGELRKVDVVVATE
ncbi:PqqD family protein [Alicyclobacillus mengziensis]|uniref:PqqD family protein n=1 Tax=Alicyclobacillus mengziensis TaxID=2931921 RepID=A0A9X7VV45_9BACL|nr:PqqD family protein [Alicyclobacillus mengziensis]QSO45460.1 PqqD family protein [Alicyclobacillus mengziensis]